MDLLRSLHKPEYLFRPYQILRRLSREMMKAPEFADVMLPWGMSIRVRPNETIGSCIWRVGIYDLCVSECLWRLLDEGETALDVGANIGHMPALMAKRLGSHGKVIALEPHPKIYEELKRNMFRWQGMAGLAKLDIIETAASRKSGSASLHMPLLFESNRGTASLEDNPEPELQSYEVTLSRLDEIVPAGTMIGVMKLDVEGHELAVLEGGKCLIERNEVRDIVFEEHDIPPTPVTQYLERRGFSIFRLDIGVFGPKAVSLLSPCVKNSKNAPNFLATIAPERALERLRRVGWRVLGNQSKFTSS